MVVVRPPCEVAASSGGCLTPILPHPDRSGGKRYRVEMSDFAHTVGVLVVVLVAGLLMAASAESGGSLWALGWLLVAASLVALAWHFLSKPSTDAG